MSDHDRRRWDDTYRQGRARPGPGLPDVFARHEHAFPRGGTALELACGTGAAAVWLARRGLRVHGVDVSEVAVEQARALAEAAAVTPVCRFEVHDLDTGLPAGEPSDVVLCNRFRDERLDGQIIERLAPGGLLAICVLSEVGAAPGRFRARPGALRTAFAELELIDAGEGAGLAWLVARKQ
ncbi:class I SAM-dependent methyltransferase [Mycolicibacterium diernhoferi]|uniref:SAM-dependent methyltransferase n=1 Tax=Mycolicibacterium diernhoferi TaxID=1801 RepID=A0A1Q4HLF7_9MYCO|nr:class I SAM-dependent methyltransferase [Mycolicibacterium diernhoferi]OJZ68357.1 SAM-dependent methyltransferase [Mycolicibacterium diernhoferi]OPE55253.1 SAM-dependent methyltransferase [Mycolicibacterium diernhoferi]PEG51339.1 class I SAM-dependent methyltransferase [Mycolicibacterium diernhoferi]QYL21141.1 class I SAM-dependent methyltransferase [Mycolicibacterium diernhoferi]